MRKNGELKRVRILALSLGTGALVLSFFSFVSPHLSAQEAGIADLDRIQSEGVSSANQEVYSPAPDHIWNRLFRLFYVRHARNGDRYGGDEVDPYLWEETKYLLTGPSHDEALKVLDEFLQQHSEKLIRDPLRRAVFQRDLLAIYQWASVEPERLRQGRSELQQRIAEVIRRLALTADDIGKLPDNYNDAIRARAFPVAYDPANPTEPFLPADIFDSTGPWVCLGEQYARPVAFDHLGFFAGRSVFLVFFQVPGGRSNTLEYLAKLRDIPKGWGPESGRSVPYPEPPQFPIGTRMALVRQLVLIDDNGRPTASRLTESVQIRVYRAIHSDPSGTATPSQDVCEFTLSRERLFSGQAGGLRAIAPGEREFLIFHSHGFDAFEMHENPERFQGEVLRGCSVCHDAAGMNSFLSYSRDRFSRLDGPPPKLIASTPPRETARQIQWIEQHGKLSFADRVANRVR
jgi:hypothetical protein